MSLAMATLLLSLPVFFRLTVNFCEQREDRNVLA